MRIGFPKFLNWKKTRLGVAIIAALIVEVAGTVIVMNALHPGSAQASWFDNSWSFRQRINIPTHTSAETNVYVTTPTFDASNTAKFKSNCGDIRFTDQSGKVLPYYIVSCSATASMHVFFSSLPAGESNYYMYYGNPSAENGFSATDFTTAATGLGVQAAAAEEVGAGPVAYWKFDDGTGTSAKDSSPNNLTGTLTNMDAPPSTRSGWQTEDQCVSGKCLRFNGSTTYVDAGNPTIIKNLTKITVSAWVKFNSSSANQTIVSKIQPAGPYGWVLRIDGNDKLDFMMYGTLTEAAVPSINTWHYIVGLYDGTNAKVYVDGVLVATSSPAGFFNSTGNVDIGRDEANGRYLNGFVDDVKIYSYARTPAQIYADFVARGSVLGVSSQVGQQSTAFLNQGLVGYWKMDEASWAGTAGEVADSSGNGNNGTAQGSTDVATTTAGKFGNAGNFDGTDDYVTVSSPANFPSGQASRTISAWIKPNLGSGIQTIFAINDTTNTNQSFILLAGLDSNHYIFTQSQSATDNLTITAAQAPSLNVWSHIVFTFDGTSNWKYYTNGNLIVSGSFGVAINTTSTNVTATIGRRSDGGNTGSYFSGQIDETRIYNRALSPDEVRQLYNFAPGPVGWWKFDEHTGSTVNDSSGNANTGTWNGTGTQHWAPGKYGSAGNFNGTNDYVSMPHLSSLDNTSQFTISSWMNAQTFTQFGGIVEQTNSGSNRVGVTLDSSTRYGNNTPAVLIGNGSNTFAYANYQFQANQWYHWEVVYNGSGSTNADKVKLYINGILVTLDFFGTIPSTTSTNTNNLEIGRDALGSTRYFNGKIDEVKVYNYARSQQQIVEDMNAGHPTGGSPLGSQLIYWKMDEGYGSTANNSGFGATSYNGTITGATYLTNAVCKVNNCLNFSGTTNNVSAGDVAFVDNAASMSASLWVNPQTLATNKMILSKANTTTQRVFQIKTDDTTAAKLKVMISSSASDTSNYCVTSASVLTASTWQHVMVVYDGTQGTGNDTKIKVYVNGKLSSCTVTGTIPGTLTSGTTSNLKLGQGDDATPTSLIAFMDELKIYNSALTVDQVRLDYNAGASLNFGTGAASESAQLSDGPGNPPVGYWNFEENSGTTANDVSGNANTGTWNGTGTQHWAPGKYGSAGKFDGTDDYVSFTTTISGVKTVGFWVYPTTTTQYFLDLDGGTHYISASSGTVSATGFTTPTIYVNGISGGSITANTWNYIAATTGTSFNTTTSMTLGKVVAGGSQFLNGRLDDVKIYNYARTQAQVAYDYNRGLPVAWWKFDECQGTTAHDSSGNNNSGTITIGGTGTQTAVGTCTTSGTAWYNGATGKFNSSINLDGTDDYVQVPNTSALSFERTNSFSASIWAKGGRSNVADVFFGKMLGSGPYTGWDLVTNWNNSILSAGVIAIQLINTWSTNALALYTTSATKINNGSWHNYVLTYDGSSTPGGIKFYEDGVSLPLTTTYNSLSGTIVNTQPVTMGARTTTSPFQGQLDDARIYNYALSASQVKTIYNDGAGVRYGPATGSP